MKEQLQYCEILKTKINVTDMEKTVGYITTHLEALKGNRSEERRVGKEC